MIVSKKATTIFIHAAGWLVFFGFPLLFMNRTQQSSSFYILLFYRHITGCFALRIFSCFTLTPGIWYHALYFIKNIWYGLIVLLLSGCVYFLQPFDNLLGHNLLKSKKQSGNARTA
jgi:two-component system LytT family sensor kinase